MDRERLSDKEKRAVLMARLNPKLFRSQLDRYPKIANEVGRFVSTEQGSPPANKTILKVVDVGNSALKKRGKTKDDNSNVQLADEGTAKGSLRPVEDSIANDDGDDLRFNMMEMTYVLT